MERNPRGRPRHPDVLTPAEWRVLEELREGGTNAEIASRLGISGDAVKYHISNMLGKLELRDRRALAEWRPDTGRGRLGALGAIPAALGLVARSVTWMGTGAAVAAGVAVVSVTTMLVIAVVATQRGGELATVIEVPVAVTRAPDTPATPIVLAPAAPTGIPAGMQTPGPTASPTPTPPPTATPTPPPTATPALGPALAPGQEIVFLGEVPEEDRSAVREELTSIISFFDDRFGVVVPEFTFYFSMEPGPLAAHYEELHDREAPVASGWAVGLLDGTTEAYVTHPDPHPRAAILAHEYYHLLQHHVVQSHADGPRYAPAWLIEGTAEYAADLYALRNSEGEAEFMWLWEALARTNIPITAVVHNEAMPWAILPGGGPIRGILDPVYYQLAASGIAWLVANSGDDHAHLSYWRLLAETDDPDGAFASAFGITVDEYAEVFEEYRAASVDDLPQIRAVVMDSAGRPLPGVGVGVGPAPAADPQTLEGFHRSATFLSQQASMTEGITASDGSVALSVLPGRAYYVSLAWTIPASSEVAAEWVFFGLPVHPSSGDVNRCGPLTALVVDDQDVEDLTIRLTPEVLVRDPAPRVRAQLLRATPEEFNRLILDLAPPCGEGLRDAVSLSGVVRGPDARPAASVLVCAVREESPGLQSPCTETTADGSFVLMVQPGMFGLRLLPPGSRYGWYGEDGFFTGESQREVIELGNADVRGIEVRLPAFITGTVLGPGSDPPVWGAIMICAEPTSPEIHPGCAMLGHDGTFAVAAPEGAVWLRVLLRGSQLGWYGADGSVVGDDERTAITIAGQNVDGIEIHLP